MRISTRGDYACRALLSLALHADEGGPTSVRDIAERTGLPQPYLEQILLALKGAGLVRSKRGVGGGYVLAREPADIKLADIVSASTARSRSATSGNRTRTAPATTRANASCCRSGTRPASTCATYLDGFTLAGIADMAARRRTLAELTAVRRHAQAAVEPGLQVGGQRAAERHPLARRRMVEGELGSVQERPARAERRPALAVDRVADERMVDRRQVDPDLVRAPGLEPALERDTSAGDR